VASQLPLLLAEDKMKIAIPVWQNHVSPLFDSSAHLLVAETSNKRILKKDLINIESFSLFQRIHLLEKLRIDIFVCGGITSPILENIRNKRINVIPFVCGDVKKLLDAIIRGYDIKNMFAMPGKSEKENIK
jgi:predicted Fe-Mo cluster-binding NifX family protein